MLALTFNRGLAASVAAIHLGAFMGVVVGTVCFVQAAVAAVVAVVAVVATATAMSSGVWMYVVIATGKLRALSNRQLLLKFLGCL